MLAKGWWWWWWRKIGCCYIFFVAVVGLFCGEKEEQRKKNRVVVRRTGNIVWLDKPDVACSAKKRAREKCKARKKEQKRTSSPSPTNTRTTTNGKASNNRPFDCNAFFFSRSLHPCGVLSLLLSFSRARACLPLTSSPPVRRSRLALCLCLSLPLSLFPHTCIHTHTISVQGHNKIRE